jgi:hypothetical protein
MKEHSYLWQSIQISFVKLSCNTVIHVPQPDGIESQGKARCQVGKQLVLLCEIVNDLWFWFTEKDKTCYRYYYDYGL